MGNQILDKAYWQWQENNHGQSGRLFCGSFFGQIVILAHKSIEIPSCAPEHLASAIPSPNRLVDFVTTSIHLPIPLPASFVIANHYSIVIFARSRPSKITCLVVQFKHLKWSTCSYGTLNRRKILICSAQIDTWTHVPPLLIYS
jgi:hypothetical protein